MVGGRRAPTRRISRAARAAQQQGTTQEIGPTTDPISGVTWNGLRLSNKRRMGTAVAILSPPLPFRFTTAAPISVSTFARESDQAVAAFTAALDATPPDASSPGSAPGAVAVEDLDVQELREPGAYEILMATTVEEAVRVPLFEGDPRWKAWRKNLERSHGTESGPEKLAGTSEARKKTKAAARAGGRKKRRRSSSDDSDASDGVYASPVPEQSEGVEVVSPGGRVGPSRSRGEATRNDQQPQALRRKPPEELTQQEWAELYSQHQWVYRHLEVVPPLPSDPPAASAGLSNGGSGPSTRGGKPQGEGRAGGGGGDEDDPRGPQGGGGSGEEHAVSELAAAGRRVRGELVAAWRARLQAAAPVLATISDLATAAQAAAGEPTTEALRPDTLLLKAGVTQWNREGAARSAEFSAGGVPPARVGNAPGRAPASPAPGVADASTRPAGQDDALDWRREVLLHVTVYAPRRNDQVSDEFVVLGSQPLTALADHIHCVARANLSAAGKAGSGGSYVFIEGVFYNDTRRPGLADLSRPIRELCAAHRVAPSHLEVWSAGRLVCEPVPERDGEDGGGGWAGPAAAPAQDTTFGQVTARLSNHPNYLFCHLGCCEHMIKVQDLRRMHPQDPGRRSLYPIQLLPVRKLSVVRSARRCDVCERNPAERVVYNDPLALANPAFFCTRCIEALHPRGLPDSSSAFPYSHATGGA